MNVKIEIKNRWTGKVLFELESENNTVKNTVVEAVKGDASLRDADLRGADLSGADLCDASLRDADLCGADLCGADLRDADLRGADLRGANLRDADLRGADLRGADLRGVKILKTIVFIGIYRYIAMPIIAEDGKHYVKLGCHLRTVEDWEKDFWNNDNEFPNDNSIKSQLRVLAYDTCKKWLEINSEKP